MMKHSALDEFAAPPKTQPSRYGRWRAGASTMVGAVAAIAVITGVGNWFYNLGTREAGSVPIIRAQVGEIKSRPADPGGLTTRHKGVASFDAATATGAVKVAAMAPAAPVPKPNDMAMAAYAARKDVPEPAAAAKPATAEPAATPAAATAPEPSPAASSGPAPKVSPNAPRRPPNLAARMKAARAEAKADDRTLARKAASSPFQIQLAADPSEDVIEKIWSKVVRANQDILRNRMRSLQVTASGGVKFYRLRVGPFDSWGEARSVCRALKARGTDCIVARNT